MKEFVDFSDKIQESMDKNYDKFLYVWKDKKYTYGEVKELALVLAERLMLDGDTPVILYGHKSIRMIISIIACIFARRAYIPIDTYMPAQRIDSIINQTGARLILNNSESSKSGLNCEGISLDGIEKSVIVNTLEEYYERETNNSINNNSIAYIIFTSGSTGEPKGVPISYDNLNNFVCWINELICIKENKKLNILNQASFSFDLSVADFYFALSNGHTLVALENEDIEEYNNIFIKLKKHKINMIVATPTFLKLLLVSKDFCDKKYNDLKLIYLCGETLEVVTAKKILERFPNIKLINAYGPTEATSAVSGIAINKQMLDEEYLPVGSVSNAATEIFIEDGEIVLKGKSVFSGYLKKCKNESTCLSEDNTYRTGDLGGIKDDLLYCYGRMDSQIKYKGYRIELNDIENSIKKINNVVDAVVVAKKKENSNIVKMIKAYIIVKNLLSVTQVKEILEDMLPMYMIPQVIEIVDKFPVNNNGKIDRKKLSII